MLERQVKAFFRVHPEMQHYAEARRTVPKMFQLVNSYAGRDVESQMSRLVMCTARVGVKEAWVITYAFLDLITDSVFTDALK